MAVSPTLASFGSLLPFQPLPSSSDLFSNLLQVTQQVRQSLALAAPASQTVTGGLMITGAGGIVTTVTGIDGITFGQADISVTALASAPRLTGTATVMLTTTLQGGGSLTIAGPTGVATVLTAAGETVGQLVQQLNATSTGVVASVNSGQLQLTTSSTGSNQSIAVSSTSGADITTTLGLANGASSGANATATVNGVTYTGFGSQGNQFVITGQAAGSLTGLQFTAAATGAAQVTVTPSFDGLAAAPELASASPAISSQPVFSPATLAAASTALVNALILQQFTPFALQQQALAFGAQAGLQL